MVQARVFFRFRTLLALFPVFFTPLLFFIQTHDQFELPKLTFLALLAIPSLVLDLAQDEIHLPTPLSLALLLLLAAQIAASLPFTSLSWQTSLLGDYENFSGLVTLVTYFLWFRIFNRFLNDEKTEKLFYFNSLAAFFCSIYAVAQHFGFDFIQWNPESVVASREFAALGNPNFLSAYLAMSIPLFLCVSLKSFGENTPPARFPATFFGFPGVLGLFFLFLGTGNGLDLLHLPPSTTFNFISRVIGLSLFSVACIRLSLFQYWLTTVAGLTVMGLGLFSTGGRAGFLGAAMGLGLWILLVRKNKGFFDLFRQKISTIPKIHLVIALGVSFLLFLILGHGFITRLGTSVLHVGQSLAVSRLHIWRGALKMFQANPLLGIGLDNFKIAFPYYSGIEFNQIDGMFMSSRMAHNELLQMACTTGLLGLLAYLGVLAAFIFMGWKAYTVSKPQAQWVLAAVFGSALAYHVQNFFSFGVSTINLLWFLLLAVVQWNYRKTLAPAGPPSLGLRLFNWLPKTAIVLLLAGLLWFPLNRLAADIAFAESSAASEVLKNPDPQTAPTDLVYYSDFEMDRLKKAIGLCPLEVKYRLYLGLAYEQRAQIDTAQARDWNLEALQCYQNAIRMSPANAYYYNDEGRVETNLSRQDPSALAKAEEAYGEAVRRDPASPFFIVNWSNALNEMGKQGESETQLKKAFDLDPAFTSKVLSQMAFEKYRAGDKPTAFRYLEEAVHGNTSSAEAYYCRGILYLSQKDKKKALADLEKVKSLNPSPEKNPSIRGLDQFIEQAKN